MLEALWGGPETLIVISSDLSHYLRYAEAQAIDRATARRDPRARATLDHEQACGATPVNGLLLRRAPARTEAELLDLRNSGDTAGDRRRVVGYAAFGFRAHAGTIAMTPTARRSARRCCCASRARDRRASSGTRLAAGRIIRCCTSPARRSLR